MTFADDPVPAPPAGAGDRAVAVEPAAGPSGRRRPAGALSFDTRIFERPLFGYALALGSVGVAAAISAALHELTGRAYLFPLLFAVIIAGWFGGLRSAIVGFLASVGVAALFLFTSLLSESSDTSNDVVAFLLFSFLALSIALMAARAKALLNASERLEGNSREALGAAETAIVQLRQVRAITDVALTRLDLDNLLHELIARICEHLQADTASVFLLSDDESMLIERTSSGLREQLGEHPQIPVGEGFAGHIAASRKPRIENDLARVEVVSKLMRERMGSAIGVPVLMEDRLIGVVTAAADHPCAFSTADAGLLELVADRMASAIVRAQLYEQSRRAAEELRRVNADKDEAIARHRMMEEHLGLLIDASGTLIETLDLEEMLPRILRLATRMIDADGYAIWQSDEDSRSWRISAADGLSADYIERHGEIPIGPETPSMREHIVVTDVAAAEILQGREQGYEAEGIRSILALPLRIGDTQMGSVTFYFRTRHEFSDEEVRIASALANLSSSAINLSRLHDGERRARERIEDANKKLAFLTRASDVLSSSLEYEETLQQVAQLAVPLLADWCAVGVPDGTGRLRTIAVAHRDPGKVQLALDMGARYPASPDPDAVHGWAQVARTHEPDLLEEIPRGFLERYAQSEEHLRMIRELALRSSLMVPLVARGNLLGALTLVTADLHAPLTQSDVPLAMELARRASIAIDNAHLYREAQRVASDLRAANAAKDEFLSLVSHELRTPITVILGNSHVLAQRSELLDPQSRADALQDINAEAQRLNRIIENLLVLARIERSSAVESEPVMLNRLLTRLVELHRGQAPWRKIVVEVADPALLANASDFGIEQTVRNFLSNAEKYSPPSDPIEIVAAREGDMVTVRVLDRGNGIDVDETSRLFEPFYRSPSTTDISGVGIGLTVCKRLIESHGGEIWARPREGGGAEFGFSLPAVGFEQPPHRNGDAAMQAKSADVAV